jgi:hypothetical protein
MLCQLLRSEGFEWVIRRDVGRGGRGLLQGTICSEKLRRNEKRYSE